MNGQVSVTSRIIVPCRFAFFNCWRPKTQYNGEAKYSLVMVIDKTDGDTIDMIEDAIESIKSQSLQVWGGRIPNNLKLPLHDGDEEKNGNSIFRNCYFMNAKSKEPPQIVDSNVKPITDQTEVYSGCYGKVSIVLYSYNIGGSRGISAWLGNIQKLKDGEPFSGRINAKDEFVAMEG